VALLIAALPAFYQNPLSDQPLPSTQPPPPASPQPPISNKTDSLTDPSKGQPLSPTTKEGGQSLNPPSPSDYIDSAPADVRDQGGADRASQSSTTITEQELVTEITTLSESSAMVDGRLHE